MLNRDVMDDTSSTAQETRDNPNLILSSQKQNQYKPNHGCDDRAPEPIRDQTIKEKYKIR